MKNEGLLNSRLMTNINSTIDKIKFEIGEIKAEKPFVYNFSLLFSYI